MSTNYYVTVMSDQEVCKAAHAIIDSPEFLEEGTEQIEYLLKRRKLHIGTFSVGWAFALHVDPRGETCPKDWDAWLQLLQAHPNAITDEYGAHISLDEMTAIVTQEQRVQNKPVLRQPYRVGHGPEACDYITGDFC